MSWGKDRILTNAKIDREYLSWLRWFKFRDNDRLLDGFLAIPKMKLKKQSLLKIARVSLLYSQRSAARSAGKSSQWFKKLEESERCGAISLNSLRAAAEAIECELVYCVRPKSQRPFSEVVFEKLAEPNYEKKFFKFALTGQIDSQKYREMMGWSKKLPRDVAQRNQ